MYNMLIVSYQFNNINVKNIAYGQHKHLIPEIKKMNVMTYASVTAFADCCEKILIDKISIICYAISVEL